MYKKYVFDIFKKNNLSNLNCLEYDIIISKNNLENRMPYTIHNTIIFNENSLTKLHKNIHEINTDFLETFIHEILHILQRKFKRKFNSFYIKYYPFLDKKIIKIKNLHPFFKKKMYNNPILIMKYTFILSNVNNIYQSFKKIIIIIAQMLII